MYYLFLIMLRHHIKINVLVLLLDKKFIQILQYKYYVTHSGKVRNVKFWLLIANGNPLSVFKDLIFLYVNHYCDYKHL